MRPSSSPCDLFGAVLSRGEAAKQVSDGAWLCALLDAEAGLARAQAALGLIPAADAAAIVAACRGSDVDASAIAEGAAAVGNPVLPLVQALRSAIPEHMASSVHKGATSQDILDTAAMLVTHRALHPLLADLTGAAGAAGTLASRYRDTAMAGRTLLQHAVPITFGLKAAGWLGALASAAGRLIEVRDTRLAVQLGGAAGTLAAYGDAGLPLVQAYATDLGLLAPELPWHTDRTRIGDLAGALGTAAGAIGKVARDITLLAQTEVAEVAEAEPGGSSAMPHKRNPIAAISAAACAAQAPGLVATLLAAMVQDHERAAGAWHAEWRPLRELIASVGSAAAWLRQCLAGLTVDESALAANLASTGNLTGGPGLAGILVDRAVHRWGAT
jgi:3-carboxy-cis,cis-muconate cycloisomerase